MADPDVLGADPRPLFFPVANGADLGLAAPPDRRGVALRTWVRSLSVMQKEALVVNGATGRTWRLASDEGPYLAGYDVGPCPLSFMTTGMVSSYMAEIIAAAAGRGVEINDVRLTLDNYYTMEGSALRGTMTGGAKPPELRVELATDADTETIDELVARAVASSPVRGLLGGTVNSLFTLSSNGAEIPVGRVAPIEGGALADPGDRFALAEVAANPVAGELIEKLTPATEVDGVGGVNSSLAENQSRVLHVRGVCTQRPDGVKEIVQNLFQPIGSEFRYLSDEAPEHGGRGLAPDAMTYMSAGIGFCFMTQFGRYAKIVRKELSAYRIAQDTHFTSGGGGDGGGGADPVETHVYLETAEGDGFARDVLDMSEQTCFLHALCRTDLEPVVRVSAR